MSIEQITRDLMRKYEYFGKRDGLLLAWLDTHVPYEAIPKGEHRQAFLDGVRAKESALEAKYVKFRDEGVPGA
jgi:hypothetical protein